MGVIDVNCDMGEGFGYHAGDERIMKQTIELAQMNSVAVGAHSSFFDKENFGRTEMNLAPEQIYDIIILQLRLIAKIARLQHARLHHVKPHGALYNICLLYTSDAADERSSVDL